MHRLFVRTNAPFAIKSNVAFTRASFSSRAAARPSWKSQAPVARYSTAGDTERRDLLKKYGPPISAVGAAGDAATALFVRAGMDKAHDRVEASVKKLLDQLRGDKDLAVMLRSSNDPGSVFTQEQVGKIASVLQKNLGLDETVTEFFDYMYRNKILSDIETVLEHYQKMVWRSKKEVHATLTCVSEADARKFAQSREFQQLASDYVPKDFRLVLEYGADSSIGDGFRLDLGERQVELTLSSLLRKFEARREFASEEHVKRLAAHIDTLPPFVSREQAAREAREYLNHPLASVLGLKEAYLQDNKA